MKTDYQKYIADTLQWCDGYPLEQLPHDLQEVATDARTGDTLLTFTDGQRYRIARDEVARVFQIELDAQHDAAFLAEKRAKWLVSYIR